MLPSLLVVRRLLRRLLMCFVVPRTRTAHIAALEASAAAFKATAATAHDAEEDREDYQSGDDDCDDHGPL